MMQVNNLEQLLAWVKSSPCQFTVSSMSGGYVHVKFLVPCDERVKSTDPDQVYTDDRGVRWRKEGRDEEITRTRCYNTLELTAVPCSELGDDDKYRKGYADGIAEVIGYVRSELDHFGG